jgi:tetratricopeptide (TPR) repeat protein
MIHYLLSSKVRNTVLMTALVAVCSAVSSLICFNAPVSLLAQSTPTASKLAPKAASKSDLRNDLRNDFRSRVAEKIGKLDFRGAVKELDAAIGKDSTLLAAYVIRADMHLKLYNPNAALADYTKAIALDPRNQQFYTLRAQIRLENKIDFNGAYQDYTRAITLDSLDPMTWYLRADVCERIGAFDSAVKDYSAALRLAGSDSPQILTRRGVCYAELGNDSAALPDLSAAIKAQPAFEPLFIRASRLLKQRKFAEAVADFDAAIRFNDKSAQAYYMRGYAKLAGGLAQSGCIDLAEARVLGFANAQKLLDEYCDVMPNLDSLRRYTFAEVVVTAKRSPEAVAITDSRRLLARAASLIANPMPSALSSLSGVESPAQQLPPGMINAYDCNKMRLEMSRPSQINPYCVMQVLMDELEKVKDATVQSILRDAYNTTQDLYGIETSGSASAATMTIDIRQRLAQQLRELNDFLGKLDSKPNSKK